jgi:hypothetical protein
VSKPGGFARRRHAAVVDTGVARELASDAPPASSSRIHAWSPFRLETPKSTTKLSRRNDDP